MHPSARVYEHLMEAEGLRLEAYQDTGGVWTIGYGHTDCTIKPGLKITKGEAGALLLEDVEKAEKFVKACTRNVLLQQGQFDALVAFCFNVGPGHLGRSTLLRKLNLGDVKGAAAEFPKWCFDAGKIRTSLVRRRATEVTWFMENFKNGTV